MPAWQRRVGLGMLLGLLAFLVTLEPSCGDFELPYWFSLEYLWVGGTLFAVPCLLAAWIAFRRQPLMVRLPRGLGLAASFGLVVAWTLQQGTLLEELPAHIWVFLFPGVVLFLTLLLTLVRRRAGWRIGLEHEWAAAEPEGSQFSLRQLLLWTAATAVLLSLARWIASAAPTEDEVGWGALMFLLIYGAIYSVIGAFWLLPTTACVGLSLCPGSRRRFAVWMVGLSLLLVFLQLAVFLTTVICSSGVGFLADALLFMGLGLTGGVQGGFLLVVLGVLGVLRLCGYRLVRTKGSPFVPAPLASPTTAWRRPFPYLVAGMVLLVAALMEPTVRIAEGRRQARADAAVQQKFAESGTTAFLHRGRLQHIGFTPNEPISEAALQLVQQYQDHCRPLELDLSQRQLTDAQLAYLAEVPICKLSLAGNPISDSGLAQLKHPEQVQSLDLSNTQITDEGLKPFLGSSGLTELYLDGTPVTDAGLKQLATLENLAMLSVANSQVTNAGTSELLRALPNCRLLPRASKIQFNGAVIVSPKNP